MKLPKNITIDIAELNCSINDEAEMARAAADMIEGYYNHSILSYDADFSDEGLIHMNIRWDD